MNKPLIFAHRTIEWFSGNRGMLKNFDVAEFDIRKTADNVLVVAHNRMIRNHVRVIRIDKSSYNKIHRYTGKLIPRLDDVIEELKGTVDLNLDLKQHNLTREIAKTVKRHKIERNVYIDSYNSEVLGRLGNMLPHAKLCVSFNYKDMKGISGFPIIKQMGYLSYLVLKPFWPRVHKSMAKRKEILPAAGLYHKVVNKGLLEFFHQRQVPVYVWPVNDKKSFKRMLELKVDGIKTSNPELIQN